MGFLVIHSGEFLSILPFIYPALGWLFLLSLLGANENLKKKTVVCKEFYISLQSFPVSSFILMAVTYRQNPYP